MSVFKLIRGDVISPRDNRKQIAPAVGAAIIGAGASLASGIIGSSSSLDNQRNLIDEMNAYNTPSKQVQRLSDAGYNPYVMAGGVNTGNQAAPGDGNGAAQIYSQGALSAAQQLGNLALTAAQVRTANAEAQGKEIDNTTKSVRNEKEISLLQQQIDDFQYKIDYMNPETLRNLENQTSLLIEKYTGQIRENVNLSLLADKISAEISGIKLDNDQKDIVKKQLEEQLRLQRRLMELQGTAAIIGADAQKTAADAAVKNADTNAALGSASKNILKHEANSAYWKSRDDRTSYWENRRVHDYNSIYYDNPTADWYHSVIPRYLPFGPGASVEARGWKSMSGSRVAIKGFK